MTNPVPSQPATLRGAARKLVEAVRESPVSYAEDNGESIPYDAELECALRAVEAFLRPIQRRQEMSTECAVVDCPATAEYRVTDLADFSETANLFSCEAHVGSLLSHDPSLPDDAEDRWEVVALKGSPDV